MCFCQTTKRQLRLPTVVFAPVFQRVARFTGGVQVDIDVRRRALQQHGFRKTRSVRCRLHQCCSTGHRRPLRRLHSSHSFGGQTPSAGQNRQGLLVKCISIVTSISACTYSKINKKSSKFRVIMHALIN